MAISMFMRVENADGEVLTDGATSSESIGSYSQADHEEEALVLAYDQKVFVPTDSRNGNVTGAPRHSLFRVKKFLDKSSPLLAAELVNPSELEVVLELWRPASGGPEAFYQVTLNRARIVEIELDAPDALDRASDDKGIYEWVSYTFESIDWEHITASTSGTDDVKGRV